MALAVNSTYLVKLLLTVTVLIAAVDSLALGNVYTSCQQNGTVFLSGDREPWSNWNYAGERAKRDVDKEVETAVENLGRGSRRRPLLRIQTTSGDTIEAHRSMTVDRSDAIGIEVVCGKWQICSKVEEEDSCVNLDSTCACGRSARAGNETYISEVKLLKRRTCD